MTEAPLSSGVPQTTAPAFPAATILGYPRIGPARELKRAVESFWAGRSERADLEAAAAELRTRTRQRLVELGLGAQDASIPGDFSFYDQVLDAATTLGAVPPRFASLLDDQGRLDLPGHFVLARGDGDRAPLEMTKWFDSNYHYLVPEISPDTAFQLADDRLVAQFTEAKEQGIVTRPAILGPVSFLLLSKAVAPESETDSITRTLLSDAPLLPDHATPGVFHLLDHLEAVVAVYGELLAALAAAGAPWVQLEEPALVVDTWDVPRGRVLDAVRSAYAALASAQQRPAIFVPLSYGEAPDALGILAGAGVEAVGLDLARGSVPPAEVLAGLGETVVVAGVVNGRNVWRGDLEAHLGTLQQVAAGLGDDAVTAGRLSVSPSTSLLHVPYTVSVETALDPELRSWLAFAEEKVGEVVALATALSRAGVEGARAEKTRVAAVLSEASAVRRRRAEHPGVHRAEVRERVAGLTEADYSREPFVERAAAQSQALALPPLPTTTIGSFPQTGEIRKARAAHRRGEISENSYVEAMRAEIRRVIELQEDIGLDVLVHGEPERNDMVQYFAENLDGFDVTEHGWVQSYGTRATRPSLLWGDVSRPAPITTEWATFAASLTGKPVKGMLTGPVTILAWSFVRDDQPLADTATQVGLALRDEVTDLEAAGIGIIQVDEPALRELLPLRSAHQDDYLQWSVRAFRLATSGVRAATQVHTHLCYSEFGEVVGAIDDLDADVTSIEAARSAMEILPDLAASGFGRGIGPGVYDIHSPRVPSAEEIEALLDAAAASVPSDLLWSNPDCGLKTRGYAEVVPALRNLVAATSAVRGRV